MQQYEIKLPQFEGPFDLLLFFIERDELDIYDIPIAKITEEFLAYLHQLNVLNIDVASEFIVVAATLMRIKAKMLLPRKDLNEQGEEIDPREELVERLIEYKKYKEVVGQLRQMESERALRAGRGMAEKELEQISGRFSTEVELHSVSLYKLLQAFQKVMQRMDGQKEKPVHKVVNYSYTIRGQKQIIKQLASKGKIVFDTLFNACENRIHAIFIFLALLELLQDKVLEIQTGNGVNNFWISMKENG